jgi:hypothetical protein
MTQRQQYRNSRPERSEQMAVPVTVYSNVG